MQNSKSEQLESEYTFKRVYQLENNPIKGNFDAAHLKEINRHIFQDLPGLGLSQYRPGEYRKPTPKNNDHLKTRSLETTETECHVAYSRMDKDALKRLDVALKEADPVKLSKMKTKDFVKAIGKIYTEADYVHPFDDGNSRTLRTFTKQLAKESGYTLDWDRFKHQRVGRDLLYIARDLSVNKLALPTIQHDSTRRAVMYTMDTFSAGRDLPDLLKDAIRPTRAIAFEQLSKEDALKKHPELKTAYAVVESAEKHAKEQTQDKTVQAQLVKPIYSHVLNKLNAGETQDFREKEQERNQHVKPQAQV